MDSNLVFINKPVQQSDFLSSLELRSSKFVPVKNSKVPYKKRQVILRFNTDVAQPNTSNKSNAKIILIGDDIDSYPIPEIGSSTGQINFYFPDTGFIKIAVKSLWAQDEIIVSQEIPWPDYVFDNEYNLMPIDSLKSFITFNKHLPNIPTENNVKENGQELAKTQLILLKKIEELTLYMIQQQKEIDNLKTEIKNLKTKE